MKTVAEDAMADLGRFLRSVRVENAPIDDGYYKTTGGRGTPRHAFLRRRENGRGKPAADGAGYDISTKAAKAVQGQWR